MGKLKLYTKTGDDGTTGLLSGKRVKKNNIRIQTYGTLDELNVWIGMIRNFKTDQNTQNTLLIIQKEIMTIASQLADDTSPRKSNLMDILDPIDEGNIKFLEKQIDLISNSTPELKILSFQVVINLFLSSMLLDAHAEKQKDLLLVLKKKKLYQD